MTSIIISDGRGQDTCYCEWPCFHYLHVLRAIDAFTKNAGQLPKAAKFQSVFRSLINLSWVPEEAPGQYAVLMGGRITFMCLFLLVNIRDGFFSVQHLTRGTWRVDVTELLSFCRLSSSVKLSRIDSRCEFSYIHFVVFCAWRHTSASVWMKCPNCVLVEDFYALFIHKNCLNFTVAGIHLTDFSLW